VSTILITGMSGTGKSTVLVTLGERGVRVADLDGARWSTEVDVPGGEGREQLWLENEVASLLATVDSAGLVLAGCAANQGRFYDRFDEVILLTAPVEVILERIRRRSTNDFGKDPQDLQRILNDVEQVQPLLQRTSTVELDATRTPGELADAVMVLMKPVRPDH
jgi:dephospho-CoA kinase